MKLIKKLKKLIIKSLVAVVFTTISFFSLSQCGPFQIYESFGGNAVPTNWTGTSMTFGSTTGVPRTGTYYSIFNAAADAIRTPQIANPGVFSFWYKRSSTATGTPTFLVQTSPDGTTWTTRTTLSTFTASWVQSSTDIGALGLTNVYIRILDQRASGTAERYVDDISLTSTVSSNNTILIQGLASCSVTITCGTTYTVYDHGGNDTYNNSKTTSPLTINSSSAGGIVSVNFTSLDTESGVDYLKLYNGSNTSAAALHTGSGFSGSTAPGSFSSSTGPLTLDFTSDVSVVGSGFIGTVTCAVVPVVTTSVSSLTNFSACTNVASTEQSFTVSGTNLSGNITVTAPTGFQITTTSGSGYSSSVTLTQSSGSVSTTTIYAIMSAQASNPTSANISCASSGATTKNISVSGTVLTTPSITTNPSNASVVSAGNTSFTVVGSNTPTSYTWQVSTDGGTNWSTVSNGGVYSTATTATLTITGATMSMSGYKYKASATNGCGTSSYSTVATLTVTYCTPTYSSGGANDYITSISLVGNNGTLSQSTASNTSPYYINYTGTQNIIPQLTKGSTYSLSITFGSDANQYNGVWIDLNQDGTLATSEFFTSNSNAGSSGTVNVSLVIPSGATTGQCLMRIRGGEDSQVTSSQACGASSSAYGQAQDYYVSIAVPVPPTITSLGSSSGCVGSSITINGTNLSGVTAANVTIGGTAVSSITTNTSTQIVAVIGSGTTGTVSVTTAGGTVTSSSTFTINSLPTFSYTGSPFSFTQNTAISNLNPSTTGTPTSFISTPSLPTGLDINGTTGVISGTPTDLQSSTSYTISASGSNGCTNTTSISIAVTPVNITCSTATTLSCGSSSGTTVGTTGVSSGLPIGATYLSGGISDYGVWYKVVGDGSSYTIVFTPSVGYDPEIDVVSGSCGTYTSVTAVDGASSGSAETVTFSTTNGVNYYIYVAHYSSGNTTTGTFTINTTITPAVPTGLTGPAVVCSNQTGVYSVTNVSGLTYNWTLPSGWTGSSTSNSITVTPGSSAGMIVVTASNGCGTSTGASISSSVNTYPSSVSAGSNTSICLGLNTPLNLSASTGTVTLYNTDCSYATGWSTNDVNRWKLSSTSNAGGSSKEFRFNYYSSSTGIDATLNYGTLINTSGYTSTSLSFRHSVDWFSGTTGFTLYLETSPDGTTWTSRWSVTPTADISYPGGASVNVNLSALDGASFYVRFRFIGNTAKINDWYIDNISITGTPTLSYSWINTTTGLSSTSVSNPTATPTSTTTYTGQASAGGCSSTNTVQITVNQPVVSSINNSIGGALSSGDYVWNGSSSGVWSTSSNWYTYNGSTFDVATSDPTPLCSTYIIPSIVTQCISSSNQPTLGSTDNIANLNVVSGGTLTLSNTLSVTGNVKIDGTVSGAGTLKMNGTGTQVISGSSLTLPNLEVNKSSGDVTVSSPLTISGLLTMSGGNLNNGSNLIGVGTSSSNLGSITWTSGSITGPLKRWFGNTTNTTLASGIFPVGNSTYNRYAQISFTSAPTSGGSITTQYVSGLPSLVYSGLPLTASDGQIVQNYEDEGYWDITPDSYTGSLSQATYNIELRGNNLSTPTDISVARIIKSAGPSHTTWSACGTHGSASGTISDFTINSTSNTGFSFFNIGSVNNSPLPIDLLDFSANCADDGILLNWRTASEYNTSHFNLEKSRDGFEWETIVTIGAAGNSTQLITYNFTDKNIIDGVNYYKLKQFDINGVFENFGPISINCLKNSGGYFSVFPNPSSNSFNIMLNNETLVGDGTITITDDMGRAIYDKNIEVKPGINLYNLDKLDINTGVYYISVKNGNFTSGVLKQIIK